MFLWQASAEYKKFIKLLCKNIFTSYLEFADNQVIWKIVFWILDLPIIFLNIFQVHLRSSHIFSSYFESKGFLNYFVFLIFTCSFPQKLSITFASFWMIFSFTSHLFPVFSYSNFHGSKNWKIITNFGLDDAVRDLSL